MYSPARVIVLGALLSSGCQQQGTKPVSGRGIDGLEGGAVARVGNQRIYPEAVAKTAFRQGLSSQVALEHLLKDSLAAERLSVESPAVATYLRSVGLAQQLQRSLTAEARRAGPPTDAEVERITERQWWQLDRPTGFRTTHVVVIVRPGDGEDKAEATARQLREKLEGVVDVAAFKKLVGSVKKEGQQIKVEDLPAVTEDGRVIDLNNPPPPGAPAATFDVKFSKAAAALTPEQPLSPVVRSAFGFHVLLLTEVLAPNRIALEQRRTMLEEQILAERAREGIEQAKTRRRPRVELRRNAVNLMALVRVRP